jgi:two-component system, OmpR family, osmolarity sensor histidine kinase EnvZ
VHEALAHARLDAWIAADIAPAVHITGYRTELVRALDNLLTNAGRYGRDDAGVLALDIRLTVAPTTATLEIADRGTGIAPQDIDRLLRPFERGDSARSGGTGAGLGLAIVDRIARLHRARFELLPNAPTGLRARLVFPRSA